MDFLELNPEFHCSLPFFFKLTVQRSTPGSGEKVNRKTPRRTITENLIAMMNLDTHRTQYPTALVPLQPASLVLDVAGAKAHKVIGCLGRDATVDFKLDITKDDSCKSKPGAKELRCNLALQGRWFCSLNKCIIISRVDGSFFQPTVRLLTIK